MEGKPQGHLITAVEAGSIADELGIQPGDRLLQVNGSAVRDVFAYRLQVLEEEILLQIQGADGEIVEFEIEKEADEEMGLEFADGLMDESNHCHNKCLFCFIDQLPPGMRDSLYFKDDDMRLSFLTGNYVTLTNIDDDELQRMIDYRLSPMNISVHTTNPELRKQMLKNPRSVLIGEQLKKISAAGIELNCQIVLCPGINDGAELERTLTDLAALGEGVLSIAVVPVGLTRFRTERNLPQLSGFNKDSAAALLDQVERWQQRFLRTRGSRVFYAADEFYLRAERPIPPHEAYDGFPQLENGVGMLSLLFYELEEGLARRTEKDCTTEQLDANPVHAADQPRLMVGAFPVQPPETVHILTGTDAAPALAAYTERFNEHYPFTVRVHAVENHFFGSSITVAGLLTGRDLCSAAASLELDRKSAVLLIVDSMLRADEDVFLDDVTPQELAQAAGCPLMVGGEGGCGLLVALDRIALRKGV